MIESLNCGCEIHGKDNISVKVNVHHWWNGATCKRHFEGTSKNDPKTQNTCCYIQLLTCRYPDVTFFHIHLCYSCLHGT